MKKLKSDSVPNTGSAEALEQKIAQLNAEIIQLRETVFLQRDEINNLRNSRIVGRIIKIRDRLGDPRTLPRRGLGKIIGLLNRVRRFIARFIPDRIRLPLMGFLRKSRDSVRDLLLKKRTDIRYETVCLDKWSPDQPLVTVVIPYFNRADTIDDTLGSLQAQTFENFETIIVNDGSTQASSKKKLDSINSIYKKKITVIDQKNQGVAAARNNGINAAKGKYIICLDSDDMIDETFIEKATLIMETNPNVDIVSSYMTIFGVISEDFYHSDFDPLKLYKDNMIITAAMFKRDAWQKSGGYKSNIGYEDWEFWITLVENGSRVHQIREPLFKYRTSMQSRFVDDRQVHWDNLRTIHSLHPQFKSRVKAQIRKNANVVKRVDDDDAFTNLLRSKAAKTLDSRKVLITIPWMTFGGAETLISNFCQEIKKDYELTFVTALKSENEWEYKFREISNRIYHLPNLLPSEALYEKYICYIIERDGIGILHIIHNGFTFPMVQRLKEKFPSLRVILTLFNDKAAYFEQSLEVSRYIDTFTTDNNSVAEHFKKELGGTSDVRVIANGINSASIFNPDLYNRNEIRTELKIDKEDLAVFFVGRLSEEKNPNVFIDAAQKLTEKTNPNLKFFIIGDGPMRKQIDTQLHKDGNAQVTYLGYQQNVASYLSAADIFVLPSSIEGFPLSVLEAMAMRVAVVASSVGAVPDVINSGVDGFVIKPGSAGEITKVITKLARNKKDLDTVKSNARKKVEEKYSNIALGTNYRDLYKG